MKRKIIIVSVVIVLIVALIGCENKETTNPIDTGNDTDNVVGQPTGNEDKQDKADNQNVNNQNDAENQDKQNSQQKSEFTAPLTGLPVDDEINTKIFAVMVNNHRLARPQSGLDQADIVYEVLTEATITRFVAVYQSQEPKVIGPVRSIRPYFIDIMNGFDALLVHAGASPAAYTTIFNNPLPDLDGLKVAGEAYWREDFREEPHNLYTSAERIRKAAEKRGYQSEGYIPQFIFYDENHQVKGDSAKIINIEYYADYVVLYKYDQETKLYKRFINSKPHTDLETKEQLIAKNILVIGADHKIIDGVGRREIDVYGPGEGYLFQNGVAREVTWQRKNGVIRAYIDGKEQGLYPGQTWIIVVPILTNVSYE